MQQQAEVEGVGSGWRASPSLLFPAAQLYFLFSLLALPGSIVTILWQCYLVLSLYSYPRGNITVLQPKARVWVVEGMQVWVRFCAIWDSLSSLFAIAVGVAVGWVQARVRFSLLCNLRPFFPPFFFLSFFLYCPLHNQCNAAVWVVVKGKSGFAFSFCVTAVTTPHGSTLALNSSAVKTIL